MLAASTRPALFTTTQRVEAVISFGHCSRSLATSSHLRVRTAATAIAHPAAVLTPTLNASGGTTQLSRPIRMSLQTPMTDAEQPPENDEHNDHQTPDASHPPVPDTGLPTPPPVTQGRVELIIGPMFAGKSTMLLKLVRQNQTNGTQVLLVKPAVDTRYTAGVVSTHTGDSLPCRTVSSLGYLRAVLEEDSAWDSISTIAIDEAQFFPDLVDFVVDAADLHHKTVLVAGLDSDFRRERFGQVHDLLQHADSITKLAAQCVECSAPAIYTRRTASQHQQQQLIGGSDVYSPVCRQHYVAGGAARVLVAAAAGASGKQ